MSKLLDDVRALLRTRHYSYRTETTYIEWIVKYIRFHEVRHPMEMGAAEVQVFLTCLAVEGKVAAATQYQVFAEDRDLYAGFERLARQFKLGFWADTAPMPPWDYRHGPPAHASLTGKIIGNRNSKIYHRPDCPSYNKVSEKNRVAFSTAQQAESAGYRIAKNCN